MRDLDDILGELTPRLEAIEAERQRCRSMSGVYLAVLVVPLAAGVAGAFAVAEDLKVFFIFGSFLWLVIGFVLYSIKAGRAVSAYKVAFKEMVMPPLLSMFDPSLRHQSEAGL